MELPNCCPRGGEGAPGWGARARSSHIIEKVIWLIAQRSFAISIHEEGAAFQEPRQLRTLPVP